MSISSISKDVQGYIARFNCYTHFMGENQTQIRVACATTHNLSLVDKDFEEIYGQALGVFKTALSLMEKYPSLQGRYETSIASGECQPEHYPYLLDLICSGFSFDPLDSTLVNQPLYHIVQETHSFENYEKDNESDVKKILTVFPEAPYCNIGEKSSPNVSDVRTFSLACSQPKLPVKFIKMILEYQPYPLRLLGGGDSNFSKKVFTDLKKKNPGRYQPIVAMIREFSKESLVVESIIDPDPQVQYWT